MTGTGRSTGGLLILGLALGLAGCGGGGGRESRAMVAMLASGPIGSACLEAGRREATRERCACVQGVANDTLSRADQRLGASFFTDPHRAQEIRQSERAGHEDFWKRWNDFAGRAQSRCG